MSKIAKVENNKIIIEPNIKSRLLQFKKQEVEMKVIEEQLKEELKEILVNNEKVEFENDDITASIRRGSERITIDSKRLKSELPDVYEEYSKTTSVSSSIIMKYDI